MNDKNGADSGCALFVVMVKGFAGSHGAALRAQEAEKCPEGIRPDTWDRLKKWAARKSKADISHVVSSLHEALWEIGSEGYGFKINVRDIPLEQEAVEIAQALSLNIFDLESADLEVKIFDGEIPEGYTCIGYAKRGRDKILVNGEEISFLNRPPG